MSHLSLFETLLCHWAEQRKLPMQRAAYEYLRGKILDVFPDYRKEAEDHLSKAVSGKKLLVSKIFLPINK